MPTPVSDALGWLVIALFAVGVLLESRHRRAATAIVAGAWGLFAVFWLQLIPHFAFVHRSYIEAVLVVAAVPACLYAGVLVWRGRETLFVLARGVAVMGLIYLPFETIPAVEVSGVGVPAPERALILTVADQTESLMNLLNYYPERVTGSTAGYDSAFLFTTADGHAIVFEIVLACTGLGSIAIFGGLIAAVRAPLRRKLRALAIAAPIIYGLNLLRTTFIGVVFGNQLMQFYVDEVLFLFGASDPYLVSFFLSDRVISQGLAVVVLVGITYLVVRELPELLTVFEDLLYLATRREYDLHGALDLRTPRTDGGSRSSGSTPTGAGTARVDPEGETGDDGPCNRL